MSAAGGQARHHWVLAWAHRGAALCIALLVALLAGLGLLAWRLAERPLELPQLARRIEAAVNERPDGPRLSIGQAAIAWEGFRGGTAAPLDIRLREVRLRAPNGTAEVELPEAALTLSARALLRGIVAPATIELRRPRLRAELTDGAIALGFDAPGGEAASGEGSVGTDLPTLLAGLMLPASDRDALAALRRIRVNGGEAVLADPAAGMTWTLLEPRLDLRRAANGGLAGEGEAVLRAGTVSVPVRLAGRAEGEPMRLSLGLSLPALRPPDLMAIWPPLAPLAVLDAPVTLTARAEFDATARPDRMEARLEAGAGALILGPGQRLPLAGLHAVLEGRSRALRVREAALRLPGQGAQPGPVVTARGEVKEREGAWLAAIDLGAGPLQLAELPRLWPEAVEPVARAAALRTLRAGLLREARARLDLRVPPSLDGVVLDGARLSLNVADAVVEAAGGRIAVGAAELAARYAPEALRLERLALRLGSATGPALTADGEALLRDGSWRVGAAARLDGMALADLAAYWPPRLGGGARDWVARNITAGRARNGQWRLAGEVPEALDAFRITALTGTVEVADATVHWLRPVPPAQGVSGTVEFSPENVVIRGRGGRQLAAEGKPGGIDIRDAHIRFFALDADPPQTEMALQVGGPLPEIFTLLRHPRLKLFEKRKLEVQATGGQAEAKLAIAFPLWAELPIEQLALRATGKVTDARLPGALIDRDVDRGNLDIAVDMDGLKLGGQAVLVGAPVKLGLEMDFRGGGQSQVTERGTLSGRMTAAQVTAMGVDFGRVLDGTVAVDAKYERRRSGQGSVALRGDLRDARLGLEALGWVKPPGAPGSAEGTLRLQGETLASLEGWRVEAPSMAARGRIAFGPRARLERVEIAEGSLNGTRFTGEVRRPEREGGPWAASLRGPVLDLRPILGPSPTPARDAAQGDDTGPPLLLDLRFDRVTMGPGRDIFAVEARARTDARTVLREARASGRTGAAPGQGDFNFTLMPQNERRRLQLAAEDGGALLAALDLADAIRGGRLTVNASYAEARPGAPLAGTAELEEFVLRDAPAAAKLLQAMTLYGLVEAMRGGSGLVFSRLVAPFALTPETLTLTDARAFSASLGLTAKGRILREKRVAAIEGTIVPAYLFNTLLGRLPVLGRLFSPEAGGGVFAATFQVQGPLEDPTVTVNPLAALTPGFLRGLFGLGGAREEGAR